MCSSDLSYEHTELTSACLGCALFIVEVVDTETVFAFCVIYYTFTIENTTEIDSFSFSRPVSRTSDFEFTCVHW